MISRGELIEIGAGFRLPELIEAAGARIVRVGSTNRTMAVDYAAAIGPGTGFVLKVHQSNYRIEGFTAQVGVAGLAGLPQVRGRGIPLVGDIGSGLLEPYPLLPGEPDADSWLRAGTDLVTASGDKLLGGPQAGLLLSRKDLVTRLARHPLARAVRIGKLTAAALEATLAGPVPVGVALAAGEEVLKDRAERLAGCLSAAGADCRAVASAGAVGGGGAPGVRLPGAAVSLPASLAVPLRAGPAVRRGEVPAVVGRTENGRLLLDLRAVAPDSDHALVSAVLAASAAVTPPDRQRPCG